MHEEAAYAERTLRAGALGYVTKQEMDDTVLTAIRRLLAGEMHTSQNLSRKFAQEFITQRKPAKHVGVDLLSDRELEVFTLIGQGQATGKIARRLNLSVKTIGTYREQLKVKLNLGSAAELTGKAMRWVETGRLG